MAEPETLSQELRRLVGEHLDADAGDSTKEEAWNLIADFTIEHADIICAALDRRSPVAISEEMVERALQAEQPESLWIKLPQGKSSGKIALNAMYRCLSAALVSPAVTAPVAVKADIELRYLLHCVETHADKFPVPSDMVALVTRIRSALVPIASAEPVAWRYRHKSIANDWFCYQDRRTDYDLDWIEEPLYALPIASVGELETPCPECGARFEDARGHEPTCSRYPHHWSVASAGEAGWRTMDSAPKDGTPVLLFFPKRYQGKGGISWGCFIEGEWLDSRAIRDNDATHWMAMPAAPAGEIK